MNQKDERTWGALVHLGGLIGMIFLSYVGNVIGALVMWLIRRNDSSFIDSQGKEALNFQITLSFLNVAIGILFGLSSGLWSLTHFLNGDTNWFFPGFHFWGLRSSAHGIVWVLNVIFSIIAAIKGSNGIPYRYPICLRIVK
ncbi:DUF4870 domain-containing protein [Chitinophaga pendula]|uniref:DUF4870 domain-containing protein n=1 Tax=Chitinophaga TaxID=79328 RepID=UPI000BAEA850|nr:MULTISPECIES: DUF4870 domain-containing protein [Chitinophaga]ASZ13192.1 hypothetical protein CK934_20610 [Chitinophaga sp. MD30]UCJ09188.1 DUF4870 domain-containing protein [Chitinophaga pendula]